MPDAVAKSGEGRLLEDLPATVWAWLEQQPESERAGPVTSGAYSAFLAALKRAAGCGGKGRPPWPHDATRHTFASYAMAKVKHSGIVSEWMGHQGKPSLLHTRYRGLTNRESAEKFFAVKPLAIGS